MKWFGAVVCLLVSLIPATAMAHELAGGGGFISGLRHPVLGFDHLLAMLSVGILSAQMGGRSLWSVPATFVAAMLLGGIIGMAGLRFFSVEFGIAVSVFVLGISIASERKLAPVLAMNCVGFFALFHGYAHGSEMPFLAKPTLYALGFISGTTAIHVAGVGLGLIAEKLPKGTILLRGAGVVIALLGLALIVR